MNEGARANLGRLAAFLGLQRSTVGLLALAVLLGLGERMAERFHSQTALHPGKRYGELPLEDDPWQEQEELCPV